MGFGDGIGAGAQGSKAPTAVACRGGVEVDSRGEVVGTGQANAQASQTAVSRVLTAVVVGIQVSGAGDGGRLNFAEIDVDGGVSGVKSDGADDVVGRRALADAILRAHGFAAIEIRNRMRFGDCVAARTGIA